MKVSPWPWLMILGILILSLWIRVSLVENKEFTFHCLGGGTDFLCHVRWAVVKCFDSYGLGYFSLFLGMLATLTRSEPMALLAGMAGVAGLILYNWDYGALGLLLGTLVIARGQLQDYRAATSESAVG